MSDNNDYMAAYNIRTGENLWPIPYDKDDKIIGYEKYNDKRSAVYYLLRDLQRDGKLVSVREITNKEAKELEDHVRRSP